MKRRLLITGAAGLLGRELSRRLRGAFDLTLLDRAAITAEPRIEAPAMVGAREDDIGRARRDGALVQREGRPIVGVERVGEGHGLAEPAREVHDGLRTVEPAQQNGAIAKVAD